MTSRISPRTGKVRKRPARPRLALTDHLANLHLLLQSKSFERWPLNIIFYAESVYRVWQKWTQMQPEKFRSDIDIVLDFPAIDEAPPSGQGHGPEVHGIKALTVDYAPLKARLEKSKAMFPSNDPILCNVCNSRVSKSGAATLMCTGESCSAVMHIECLSSRFLRLEAGNKSILPTHGPCPSCDTDLKWVDLVKILSLRMRGEKETQKVLKLKRGKKATAAAVDIEDSDPSEDDQDALDLVLRDEDDWRMLTDTSDDGQEGGMNCHPTQGASFKLSTGHSKQVIDESDWDDAEIVT